MPWAFAPPLGVMNVAVPRGDDLETGSAGFRHLTSIQEQPWTIMQESMCSWTRAAFAWWMRLTKLYAKPKWRTNRKTDDEVVRYDWKTTNLFVSDSIPGDYILFGKRSISRWNEESAQESSDRILCSRIGEKRAASKNRHR